MYAVEQKDPNMFQPDSAKARSRKAIGFFFIII